MGSIWGILPAAGNGTRIQPLAFSKELLPVGSSNVDNKERPKAISEYLIDRMLLGGVEKLCIVISSGKSDILRYYGAGIGNVNICYAVQPNPAGLCDAIFRALPFINDNDHVIVGLPDTVWFPDNGLTKLPDQEFSFLLFPVEQPQYYDSVEMNSSGHIKKIHVKQTGCTEKWIWGAFKLTGAIFRMLYELWLTRDPHDEYFGTLVNAYLEGGGIALGIRAGKSYVDVGTLNGYREAIKLLTRQNDFIPEITEPKNE